MPRSRARHARIRPLFALAAFALILLAAAPARAKVRISGTVQYWDSIDGRYRPARNVHVEVEGDWFWRTDPDVRTDRAGRFSATVGDPPAWWGDYDGVDVEVYAETPGLIQVYEYAAAVWPYHVISREKDDVDDGQRVRIDVRIGGPRNNIGEAYYRDAAQTANAFLVHQEMLDHHDRLVGAAFRTGDFDEVEVIAPAVGQTSYYNYLTGFVNLVVGSGSGTGSWRRLPGGASSWDPSVQRFRYTVRHEYSHAVHDELTGVVAPAGLNIPSTHSPGMEAGEWLAYTEGFAEFLPLTTIPSRDGGRFDPTFVHQGATKALPIPGSYPSLEHAGWEGEFAAALWDLYDGEGEEARIRHPARWSEDGVHRVPSEIVEGQHWTDRLSDPRLARIRRIVSDNTLDTPQQFLAAYRDRYRSDLHALKAIAFNRDLPIPDVNERKAEVTGRKVEGFRQGDRVTLTFDVVEPDREDRPFVHVAFWRRKAGGAPRQVDEIDIGGGWNGSRRPVRWVHAVRNAADDDVLWIVVNDETFPSAHRLEMPGDVTGAMKALGKQPGPARSGNLRPRRPPAPRAVKPPPPAWEAYDAHRTDRKRVEKPAPTVSPPDLGRADYARLHRIREIVEKIHGELRTWAEGTDALAGQRRAFASLARESGALGAEVGPEAVRGWAAEVAAGRAKPRRSIPAEEAQRQVRRIGEAIQARRGAARRLASLAGRLAGAAGAARSTPGMGDVLVEGLDRAVRAIDEKVRSLSADESGARELETYRSAWKRLAR